VEAGIACIMINYRLAADASWPAQVEDCAAAVAWTRRAAVDRGGDPGRIFVIGHSSGAMLAAVLASDWRWLASQKLKPTDLAGVVPMGSIMWDEEFDAATASASAGRMAALFPNDSPFQMFGTPETYRNLWPMKHVNAAMPPLLFLVAETEQELPPILRHAKTFCESARKLGVQADWRVLPNRTHYTAIRMLSDTGDPTFALIRDFVFRRKTS
jgi:acetyl esterase/lipase